MLEIARDLEEGDYAECGVYKGEMAAKIARHVPHDSVLWLFDSFEGHAWPTEYDDAKSHPRGRYKDTSIMQVMDILPSGTVYRLIPGWIPDSLASASEKKFRFVHIDLDHYLPTKGAAEFFKPRMVPGGIIRFDDYLHPECPGATKAIDDIFPSGSISESDWRWIAP